MVVFFRSRCCRGLALVMAVSFAARAFADPVPVRRKQETMHRGFVLKSPDGKLLATGEETAQTQGALVHSRLTFHFRDGSLDDEQTVFTQDKVFHLISDHHVQIGSSFPTPLDVTVDPPAGTVTWHDMKGSKDTVHSEHLHLPDDLANGIMPLLAENYPLGTAEMKVAWIAVDIRPLLVTLSIKPVGTQTLDPDGITEKASEYVIHPVLPSVIGFLARVASKQPADLHIWVTDQAQPSFVQLVGPFFDPGPVWTVNPTGPAQH